MEAKLSVPMLARDLQGLCAEATSVGSALEGLLDMVESRLGNTRAFAVARSEHGVVSRGDGLPEPTRRRFVQMFESDEPSPSGPDATPIRPLSIQDSYQILAFSDRSGGFTCTLVLQPEDGVSLEWVDPLQDSLDAAAPAFARVAEMELLRHRLGEARNRARHLEAVFDALPDPVVVLDPDDRLILANRRAELIFQSPGDDSEGRRRAVETNNLFFSAFRARSAFGHTEADERELVLVDPEYGDDLLCEVKAVHEGVGDRSDSETVYILRDITDLRRAATELESHYRRLLAAEHRLRRDTERLNVIIENAGVPILVTDDRSDIVLLNREAERLFQVEPAGGFTSDFPSLSSNDAALTGLINDFLLQPTSRREEEVELVDPDANRQFPARVTLTKIATARGEPTAVVSVLHDLTSEAENQALAEKLSALNAGLEDRIEKAVAELAERNRQLEVQRAELSQASRLKTEFLAMMSHELRTPLNSILGYSSLLSEGLLGELTGEQKRALAKTRGASEHLLSLINDILDLSKVEAGKMTLAIEEIPVAPFMGDFAEAVRHLVEGEPIDFRIQVEKGLSPIHVDPTRLRQVLLNLVSNAIKFTDEGFVEVRIGSAADGARIRFEVEDTGIGIDEANLEVIFEGFRQLESFPTRAQKGTGLGLAISRKLVGLMGGQLEVRSAPGEGSTFTFSVPVAGLAVRDGIGPEPTPDSDGAQVVSGSLGEVGPILDESRP